MRDETQKQAILRILREHDGWVSRQELINETGYQKGYATIIGNGDGTARAHTFVGLGWVETRKDAGRVSYRMTELGRRVAHAEGRPQFVLPEDAPGLQRDLVSVQALGGGGPAKSDRTWPTASDLDAAPAHGPHDPARHVHWAPEEGAGEQLEATRALPMVDAGLQEVQADVPEFDPSSESEGKGWVFREIAQRQGAPRFRKALLEAFGRTCCITGCQLEEILEAAHIRPYDGPHTNDPTNGLLLRADIHTLFDLGMVRIDPQTLQVHVHPRVRSSPDHARYHMRTLLPSYPSPSRKALDDHWQRCQAKWDSS